MDTRGRHGRAALYCASFYIALCAPALWAQTPVRFTITGFTVEGPLQSEAAKHQPLLAPFTGENRTLDDLQSARAALEGALREDGHPFAIVRLPAQTMPKDGSVALQALEYRIGRVTVDGAEHHDEANVLNSLPALSTGATPALGALNAQLQLANANPVKRTAVVMEPGLNDTVNFDVQVRDARPWRIATTLDNTGTDETGRLRLGLGFQYANLWNRDHVLSAQYVTAPHDDDHPSQLALPFEDDVRIWGASYIAPIPQLRGSLEVYGGGANVDSGVVAGVFDITGKGSVIGTRFTLNLPAQTVWAQRVSLGYKSRKYDNDVQITGGSEQLVPDYRTSPLELGYQADARYAKLALSGGVTFAQNLPGGSLSSDADFDEVRAGAVNDYLLVTFNAGAHYDLGRGGELALRLDGQYTDDLLVPGEQFGIGGASSVRGLEERQFTADRGLSASLEYFTPNLFPKLSRTSTRLTAFIDGANGKTLQPTGFEDGSIDVASGGLGLRFATGHNLSLQLDYGFVFDPNPALGTGNGRWHGVFSWFF